MSGDAGRTRLNWHPEVIETGQYIDLVFGDQDTQSRMNKADPYELVFSYAQAMMAFLLFVPEPRDVLIIGLGGGSLSKFCYRHLPNTRITTVEISQEVIDLRERFRIPPDDDRFRIIHGDIAHWIEGKDAIADVILLDGYDAWGVPTAISEPIFYSNCMRAIREHGMLVANLNLGAMSIVRSARALATLYKDRCVSIRSISGGNDVFLGFQDTQVPEVRELRARARELMAHTGVDFPFLLDKVRSGLASRKPVSII